MTLLRWEVPVDDLWHYFTHNGEVAHVGSRQGGLVEFWTIDASEVHRVSDGSGNIISEIYEKHRTPPRPYWYRVYGTGQDTDGMYVGTTYDGGTNDLVWHLFERAADPEGPRE